MAGAAAGPLSPRPEERPKSACRSTARGIASARAAVTGAGRLGVSDGTRTAGEPPASAQGARAPADRADAFRGLPGLGVPGVGSGSALGWDPRAQEPAPRRRPDPRVGRQRAFSDSPEFEARRRGKSDPSGFGV